MSTASKRHRTGRLRVLLWPQHLSGVGHYVRTMEIARALAERHQVWLVEGGRDVPRGGGAGRIRRVRLPGIRRGDRGIEPVDRRRSLERVMAARRAAMQAALQRIRPDVLVIEHFPFSKWQLADEYIHAISMARTLVPGMRVVSSVRDVVAKTRYENVTGPAYRERVISLLGEYFDAVLVHSDPSLLRLEASFPAAGRIPVPVHYTGVVSEKPSRKPRRARRGAYLMVSSGGGTGNARFVESCVAAWNRLGSKGGSRELVVFAGLGWEARRRSLLRSRSARGRLTLKPFSTHFLDWMAGADLVICHAGYNTCANILETRVPAILVPDPQMSDQMPRATKLARRGLVQLLTVDGLTAERLASAMRRGLGKKRTAHAVDLDGAENTRRLLERL